MNRIPLLLHPITLTALAVLVANDHWLKYSHPSVISGKASDFAGLVLLPMLVLGGMEAAVRRPAPARIAWGMCGATGLGFAAAKLFEGPNAVADKILGGQVLVDAWDLVALPALLVPLLVSNLRSRRPR